MRFRKFLSCSRHLAALGILNNGSSADADFQNLNGKTTALTLTQEVIHLQYANFEKKSTAKCDGE